APIFHERRMADAESEHESIRPGFCQCPATVHHCDRVSSPNVGDAGRNRNPAGGREDDGAGRKHFTRQEFADPDGAETHLFDFGHGATEVWCPQKCHHAQPHAGASEVYFRAGCRVCSLMKASTWRQASAEASLCCSNVRSKNEWGAPS